MTEHSGRFSRLTKVYGDRTVIDDVSFDCDAGKITALIGPNGSGKSTALRVLLGHVKATSGAALCFGVPYVDLVAPATQVGVLLDAGAQHEGRSVRETVRLAALTIGVPHTRAAEVLGLVGLESVQKRRVGALSLGMRQRLGLAIALLGRPQFLVLDEPANGLDPDGISWLNSTLRSFADSGGAVLLSSHHLGDIESLADQVVIMDQGRVAYAGDAKSSTEQRVAVCVVESEVLRNNLVRREITFSGPDSSHVFTVHASADAVSRLILDEGLSVRAFNLRSSTLLERYAGLTSGQHASRPWTKS